MFPPSAEDIYPVAFWWTAVPLGTMMGFWCWRSAINWWKESHRR